MKLPLTWERTAAFKLITTGRIAFSALVVHCSAFVTESATNISPKLHTKPLVIEHIVLI